MSSTSYMRDPPSGEDRWAAGSFAMEQEVIGAAVFAVSTLTFGLRVFTRLLLTKSNLRSDDYLSGISLLSCWLFYGCTVGMIKYGGCARNFWQVTESEYQELLKWTIPVNIFYMLSSDFAKLSLLTLYLNLSPDRTFRITVKIIGLCFILYAVAYALTSIFSCRPIYASWDLTASATATCIDKEMFYLAASIANVCMDVIILLVPLRIVVPLQIPKRQKVSLLFLFATGGFVIFVAIYNSTLTVALFNSDNYTWGLAHELSWMYGELAGCVICASASSLRPFFVRYLPSLINSHFGSTGKSLGTSKQHSRGVGGSRLQISRKQPDAYELKSHDDSSSSKEIVQEDDEAHLWLRQGEASCNVTTTLADKVVSRKPSLDVATGRWIYNTARFPDLTSTRNGINVVHTMEVSYSKPARR